LKINSATEYIERYCNRNFAKADRSGVFTVRQDGSIILDSPPVETVNRICFSNGGFLIVKNTTQYSPTYSTSPTGIRITHVEGGLRIVQAFTYADCPTLESLATAINGYGHGWTATVTGNYGYMPTSDIVAFQFGKAGQTLLIWQDYEFFLAPSIWPTNNFFAQQYDVSSGILDWVFPRGLRVRIDYTSGFDPVPAPIVEVAARLVLEVNKKKSETLGNYTYTLDDLDKLPNSDRQILSRYKDRTV